MKRTMTQTVDEISVPTTIKPSLDLVVYFSAFL